MILPDVVAPAYNLNTHTKELPSIQGQPGLYKKDCLKTISSKCNGFITCILHLRFYITCALGFTSRMLK